MATDPLNSATTELQMKGQQDTETHIVLVRPQVVPRGGFNALP
jgi:hypothetical protein